MIRYQGQLAVAAPGGQHRCPAKQVRLIFDRECSVVGEDLCFHDRRVVHGLGAVDHRSPFYGDAEPVVKGREIRADAAHGHGQVQRHRVARLPPTRDDRIALFERERPRFAVDQQRRRRGRFVHIEVETTGDRLVHAPSPEYARAA